MGKKSRVILAVLLILTIVNFATMTGSGTIRTVEFVSIFVMGALSALLLNEFLTLFKTRRDARTKGVH